MVKKDIIVIGAFPQTFEDCRDAGLNIIGTTDYDTENVGNVTYLGNDEDFIVNGMVRYPDVLYVVTPDAPRLRRKIVEQYGAHGARFATIIVPTAKVSDSAELGEGTVILHNGTV